MSKQTKKTKQAEAAQVIGAVTTYLGEEHGYMKGYKVKIIAVLTNAASPDYDPDAETSCSITDDEELQHRGGVTANDRLDVQPWIEKEGRFSWVSSDARVTDTEMFKHLRK